MRSKFLPAVLVCTCYLSSGLPVQGGSPPRSTGPLTPKVALPLSPTKVAGVGTPGNVLNGMGMGLGTGSGSFTQGLGATHTATSGGLTTGGIAGISTAAATVGLAAVTLGVLKASSTLASTGNLAGDLAGALGSGVSNIAKGIAGALSVAELD